MHGQGVQNTHKMFHNWMIQRNMAKNVTKQLKIKLGVHFQFLIVAETCILKFLKMFVWILFQSRSWNSVFLKIIIMSLIIIKYIAFVCRAVSYDNNTSITVLYRIRDLFSQVSENVRLHTFAIQVLEKAGILFFKL